MRRIYWNVGPASIFFFIVFTVTLFVSINWKLTYTVTKEYVDESQRLRDDRVQRDLASDNDRSSDYFERRHRRLTD